MDKLALCISCLNGEWTAAGVRRGTPTGVWQSPNPVDEFASSAAIFRESITQTRAEGRTVGLVLAHPRLTDQVVDIPPIKGWKLARYLDRRVQQVKTFDGEAAWSFQRAMPTKGNESALVHLFPKGMLEELSAGCAGAGGQLLRVLPSTSVLASQLKELPIERDELVLIAAETGQSTTVIIGRKDGRVCLGRVLRGTWNQQADRVAVDLTRTIGFAEQQTGLTINSVWLFGAGAAAKLPEVQKIVRPTVRLSPVPFTPVYWATQAAIVAATDDGNLIAPEQREAPRRRRLFTLTTASLLFMLLAAFGVAVWAKRLEENDRDTIVKLDAEILRWQTTRKEWQDRHTEAARKRDLVRVVADQKPAAVPAWLLGYLGEASPADLLLTSLDLERTNDAWSVRIVGAAQPSTNNVPIALDSVVGQFTTNLVSGPFRMKITRTRLGLEPGAGPNNSNSVLSAIQNAPVLSTIARGDEQTPASPPLSPGTFQLEGIIR